MKKHINEVLDKNIATSVGENKRLQNLTKVIHKFSITTVLP